MQYWLFKADPDDYGFDDLVRDKTTVWEGVRNNQALSFLRQARKSDQVLIYHTGDEKQIVGLAAAATDSYADPKQKDPRIVVVDLKAGRRLKQPVLLARIKEDQTFAGFYLVRMPRLSVMPVAPPMWKRIIELGGG